MSQVTNTTTTQRQRPRHTHVLLLPHQSRLLLRLNPPFLLRQLLSHPPILPLLSTIQTLNSLPILLHTTHTQRILNTMPIRHTASLRSTLLLLPTSQDAVHNLKTDRSAKRFFLIATHGSLSIPSLADALFTTQRLMRVSGSSPTTL